MFRVALSCSHVCVSVSVVSIIVKCPVLPPCAVDEHSRNPLYYYYLSCLGDTGDSVADRHEQPWAQCPAGVGGHSGHCRHSPQQAAASAAHCYGLYALRSLQPVCTEGTGWCHNTLALARTSPHIYANVDARTHGCRHTYMHICMRAHMHAHMHTCMHAHTHVYMRARTHTHTHTHTRTHHLI